MHNEEQPAIGGQVARVPSTPYRPAEQRSRAESKRQRTEWSWREERDKAEGVKAKGSCGEQDAGKEEATLPLLSLPGPVPRPPPSAGGVGGGCADPPLPNDGRRTEPPLDAAPPLSFRSSNLPLQAHLAPVAVVNSIRECDEQQSNGKPWP